MERTVLFLCGLWLWLTRKRRATRYAEVANSLQSARLYLFSDYANRASTRDRGCLLPDQVEALRILDRQHAVVSQTSRRFETLAECYRLVAEELTQPPKAA
jgi:hypothetical protein